MIDENAALEAVPRIRIEELSQSNREVAIALAIRAWDRPTDAGYLAWRYGRAPAQEAALALASDVCVATMFALRRTYRTPSGICDVLEPFEWHADPAWRTRGAGLRVVKHWMAGARPLIALGGTQAATQLFARLRWSPLCVAGAYNLPLRSRFLRARGRGRAFAAAFDAVVRHYFTPHPGSGSVRLSVVPEPGELARTIAESQRRFAWMRIPDQLSAAWLRSAPRLVGEFIDYHLSVDGEVVGWATARRYQAGGVSYAAIQECFLRDEARGHYSDAVRVICVALTQLRVDAIHCVTTCPDTIAALRGLHFRHDDDEHVFVWNGGRPVTVGPALLDAGHADRAFFPVPTSAEARALATTSR